VPPSFDCADADTIACQRAPRTALALTADRRTLILAVVDGWQAGALGMTAAELAGLLVARGARDAVLLDGGSASTLFIAGEGGVVNAPSDGAERPVANHLTIRSGPTVARTMYGVVREGNILTGPDLGGVRVVFDDGRAVTTPAVDASFTFDNVPIRWACVDATKAGYDPVHQCRQMDPDNPITYNSIAMYRSGTGPDAGVDAAIDAPGPIDAAADGPPRDAATLDAGGGGGGGDGCCRTDRGGGRLWRPSPRSRYWRGAGGAGGPDEDPRPHQRLHRRRRPADRAQLPAHRDRRPRRRAGPGDRGRHDDDRHPRRQRHRPHRQHGVALPPRAAGAARRPGGQGPRLDQRHPPRRHPGRRDHCRTAAARLRLGKHTEVALETADAPAPLGEFAGDRFGGVIGTSPPMKKLFALLARVAPTDATVLIEGETGTGKEAIAEALHQASGRALGPFVVVDCASIPRELIASELFGHAKGSYTGAIADKRGLIEAAHGGTLFLDEIGELPLDLQPKLLRALEQREVRRVGETRPIPVDIRVLAATHRDLRAMVKSGGFREDLFYRLAVVRCDVPPLRARPGDLPTLARFFADSFGRSPWELSPALLADLARHDWPGNVRELRNVVERALSLGALGVDDDRRRPGRAGADRRRAGQPRGDLELPSAEGQGRAGRGLRARLPGHLLARHRATSRGPRRGRHRSKLHPPAGEEVRARRGARLVRVRGGAGVDRGRLRRQAREPRRRSR
jgi:hypothetical protein